jgi:hypothetical protein
MPQEQGGGALLGGARRTFDEENVRLVERPWKDTAAAPWQRAWGKGIS